MLAQPNNFVDNLYSQANWTGDMKIAIISDLHLDYDYTTGMATDCDKPVCCRSDSGVPKDSSKAAGKWGDYNCDLNPVMLDSMFAKIKSMNPDALFWVGDSIPHNLESLTFQSNVDIMKNITKKIKETFLDAGITVVPVIGNHDSFPADHFENFKPRDNKNIEEWAKTWSDFIDDED
jgi:sphingomyelin phosphodiesterase